MAGLDGGGDQGGGPALISRHHHHLISLGLWYRSARCPSISTAAFMPFICRLFEVAMLRSMRTSPRTKSNAKPR